MGVHRRVTLHRTKISISNLDFFYGAKQPLHGVSLAMPERQVTAVIGPSGCGKSTLLRVLNRMYDLYPDQRVTGQVQMDGSDILGPEVDIEMLQSCIGMVFQQPAPFLMSIYDNVAFGLRLFERLSRSKLDQRVEAALTRADFFAEVKDRLLLSAANLSGGQQQHLCIARAIATRPQVLLLDEPTGALDPISMAKIEQLIDQLKETLTIAIVTHNRQQAARCADQVAFFYLGELVELGFAEEIFIAPREQRTREYIGGRFSRVESKQFFWTCRGVLFERKEKQKIS